MRVKFLLLFFVAIAAAVVDVPEYEDDEREWVKFKVSGYFPLKMYKVFTKFTIHVSNPSFITARDIVMCGKKSF